MSYKKIAYVRTAFPASYEVDKLTHFIYAFAEINGKCGAYLLDGGTNLTSLVTTVKTQDPSKKVILGVGGWGCDGFSDACLSSTTRTTFINSIKNLVDTYNCDGVDIDWEYPCQDVGLTYRPEDGDNFVLLMQEMRVAMSSPTYELSIAAANYYQYTEDVDCYTISLVIDSLNIMCYDMGLIEQHHSNLYNSIIFTNGNSGHDIIYRFLVTKGISANKIIYGLPFYGKQNIDDIDWSSGDKTYSELLTNYISKNGWSCNWDSNALVPYLTKSSEENIFYENEMSI